MAPEVPRSNPFIKKYEILFAFGASRTSDSSVVSAEDQCFFHLLLLIVKQCRANSNFEMLITPAAYSVYPSSTCPFCF